MKKILSLLLVLVMLSFTMVGCLDQATVVDQNLREEADNFNIIRQVTVINDMTDTIQVQVTGRISIESDNIDNQLIIIAEHAPGEYKKHIIGKSIHTSYVVEDITGPDVDPYNFTINFNPKMAMPIDVRTVD